MQAGRDLDALVAEHVTKIEMHCYLCASKHDIKGNCSNCSINLIPNYSTDIAAAMTIMPNEAWKMTTCENYASACVAYKGELYTDVHELLSTARCLAALKAVDHGK